MTNSETLKLREKYTTINDGIYTSLFRTYESQLGVLKRLDEIETYNPIKKLRISSTKRKLNRSLKSTLEAMERLVVNALESTPEL